MTKHGSFTKFINNRTWHPPPLVGFGDIKFKCEFKVIIVAGMFAGWIKVKFNFPNVETVWLKNLKNDGKF